jgi:hypothetical protein
VGVDLSAAVLAFARRAATGCEPTAEPLSVMVSFSVPPLIVPVLPARRMMVSLPESPVTVARPAPVKMQSPPASPTMVPGPGIAGLVQRVIARGARCHIRHDASPSSRFAWAAS